MRPKATRGGVGDVSMLSLLLASGIVPFRLLLLRVGATGGQDCEECVAEGVFRLLGELRRGLQVRSLPAYAFRVATSVMRRERRALCRIRYGHVDVACSPPPARVSRSGEVARVEVLGLRGRPTTSRSSRSTSPTP